MSPKPPRVAVVGAATLLAACTSLLGVGDYHSGGGAPRDAGGDASVLTNHCGKAALPMEDGGCESVGVRECGQFTSDHEGGCSVLLPDTPCDPAFELLG